MLRRNARPLTLLVAAAVGLLGERAAQAQGFYWSLKYDPSVPVGSVRSFVPNVSPLGFDIDARYWFKGPNLSIGLGGVYNRFYRQSPQATYPAENGAVTATLYRIIDVVALVPEVHYYFGPDNVVVPYLGVGAGFASVKFHVLVSDFDLAESSTGLILSPEAGVLIPFDRDGMILQAVTVGLRGSFITAGFRDVSNTSYFGLTLGLMAY
jgi:opacity protein-like surface antigen